MDDDVEEMKTLRSRFQRGVGTGSGRISSRDAESDDDDIGPSAAVNSAVPAPVSTKKQPQEDSGVDSMDDMAKIMGFSGFASGNRKSRTFDIDALVNEARQRGGKSSQNDSDSDDEGFAIPLPPKNTAPKPVQGPSRPVSATITTNDEDEDDIGPVPVGSSASSQDNEEESDDEDVSDDEPEPDNDGSTVPCNYDLLFEHGDKAVSALGIDPVGARFVTGSVDYEVKLWDFGGMQANLNPFRSCKPCESHAINDLSFSNGGEYVLVVSGSAQAKVINRDGYNVMECPKGWQYLMDMASTKGHIAMLNAGQFSPKQKDEFITSSHDGTVRVWNMNDKEKHKSCIKLKAANGRRTHPTTCAYSKDGRWIVAGVHDGSIQLWDASRSSFVQPAKIIRQAHANESDITSVSFSYDAKMICSRGADETLKLWDISMLKKPVFEAKGLDILSPLTDCLFSPSDKLVVTGTAANEKTNAKSKLVFFDRSTWQVVKELEVADSSVCRVAWHPRLNQIFATTAAGTMKVFFDPNKSHNGALLCRTSKKRRAKAAEAVVSDYIITPYALPMFKEEKQRSKQAQFERNRKDPVKSHRPDLPVNGPGTQGRVGQSGGTLSSFLVKKLGYAQKMPDQDMNPREALLRHADAAKNDPYWIAPAYHKTQPKPIFLKPEEEATLQGPASKKFKPTGV